LGAALAVVVKFAVTFVVAKGSYELFKARFLHRKGYLAYDREEPVRGGRPYNTD
jgi:hypothetical protein